MRWGQCLPLSVVQLKGKHCQKSHCRNGVVDTFEPGQLSGGHWIEYRSKFWFFSSSKFRIHNITKKIPVQHFWFRFRFLFSKNWFWSNHFESLSCLDGAQKIDFFWSSPLKKLIYTANVSPIKIPVSQNVPCNMHIDIMGIACIPTIPVISHFR